MEVALALGSGLKSIDSFRLYELSTIINKSLNQYYNVLIILLIFKFFYGYSLVTHLMRTYCILSQQFGQRLHCATLTRTLPFTCVANSNMAHYNFKKITVVPSAKVRTE